MSILFFFRKLFSFVAAMDDRKKLLNEFRTYLKKTDTEITMILQNLQWDREQLLKDEDMRVCTHDTNHRIPANNLDIHENGCYLKCHGYSKQDCLLPDPFGNKTRTLVKLCGEEINQIITSASNLNSSSIKESDCTILCLNSYSCVEDGKVEPLTLERLQWKYTVDERRAIYDAVVAHTPSQSDITELELPGTQETRQKPKTKLEVLAELRDMKRRRPKYRVATKSKNYSEVLREVIKNQMEWYGEIQGENANRTEKLDIKLGQEESKKIHKTEDRNHQTNNNNFSTFKSATSSLPNEYNSHHHFGNYRGIHDKPNSSKSNASDQIYNRKHGSKRYKERHDDYNDCKKQKYERNDTYDYKESKCERNDAHDYKESKYERSDTRDYKESKYERSDTRDYKESKYERNDAHDYKESRYERNDRRDYNEHKYNEHKYNEHKYERRTDTRDYERSITCNYKKPKISDTQDTHDYKEPKYERNDLHSFKEPKYERSITHDYKESKYERNDKRKHHHRSHSKSNDYKKQIDNIQSRNTNY